MGPVPEQIEANDEQPQAFTFGQKVKLALITWAGIVAIRLIGPTIQFKVICEEGGPPTSDPLHVPAAYAFWHQCVFASVWFWRNRDIAVMTSQSFDGEYIARIIEHFGFRAVRGSSSRGAVKALLGMKDQILEGRVAAFTIDGPRGPIFVAKPGPVLLARKTAEPLVVFHIALEKKWELNSWDRTQLPKPFTNAVVYVSRMMSVTEEDDEQAKHAEMQAALERVRDEAESQFVIS